jgi:hypothetical protein
MKNIKALRAVALTAALALSFVATARAVGFPELLSLNSEVGYSAGGGRVFGAGSSTATTPLLLLSTSTQQTYGWVEDLQIDSAAGASATVQVLFYDATSTATCNSATEIGSFTLLTNTTQAVANSGTYGALRTSLGNGGRIPLDWYIQNNLYVGIASPNPDTVTAAINIGRVKDATLNVRP